jgi:D-sedoheptulose 7-phosphate isomerase
VLQVWFMKNIQNLIEDSLTESVSTKQVFWKKSRNQFFQIGDLLVSTVKSGNKVMIFGNGGSACDAMHFAGEWVNRYNFDRDPLPCVALTSDAPLLSCISNDSTFEAVFERQIKSIGRKGDIAIGISTSGNSKNVIRAFAVAQKMGIHSIALLGGEGGKILSQKCADHVLLVDGSQNTPRIQETHEWILHGLSDYVEHMIYGAQKT